MKRSQRWYATIECFTTNKDTISNKDRKKNTQAWNEEATEMGMKKCNYGTTDLVVI